MSIEVIIRASIKVLSNIAVAGYSIFQLKILHNSVPMEYDLLAINLAPFLSEPLSMPEILQIIAVFQNMTSNPQVKLQIMQANLEDPSCLPFL